jgi:chromosome segregation ATPase
MPEGEPASKIPKSLQGSVPAWVGAGGMVLYIALQAMGMDLAQLTGKGLPHKVETLEKQVAGLDNRVTGNAVRVRTLEQQVGILYERTDTAKEERADIKRALVDINRAMGSATSSLARIEAKLDRN